MKLDLELVVRSQRGELAAQEELVAQLAPMVFRLASRFFRSREDVEDLAQDAFARFFSRIDQLRPHDNVVGWVSRVTINVCYDRLRKLQREREALERYGKEPRAVEAEPYAHERIRAAVDRLDVKFKVPLLLKEIEGLSIREISEMMELSPSNVKIRLYRARKKLASLVEDLGDAVQPAEGPATERSRA